jgi:hypothetical protein
MTNNKQQTAVDRKIGNSDKSLVIYTHDDVIEMMNRFHTSILNRDLCMAKLTPIKITIKEYEAFKIFKAGQESMEDGGKSFDQFWETYGGSEQ